jgi:hypothetical protein
MLVWHNKKPSYLLREVVVVVGVLALRVLEEAVVVRARRVRGVALLVVAILDVLVLVLQVSRRMALEDGALFVPVVPAVLA